MISHMRKYILLITLWVVLANGKSFQSLVQELKLNPSDVASSAGDEISLAGSDPSLAVAERRRLNQWLDYTILAAAGLCNVVGEDLVCFLAHGAVETVEQVITLLVDDEEECTNSRVPPRNNWFGQERRNYNKGCGMEYGFPPRKLVQCGDRKACCCPNGSFNPQNDFAKYAAIFQAGPQGCFACARRPRCEEFISRKQCRQWQGAHDCDCDALNVRESIDDFEIFKGACRTSSGGRGTYTVTDRRSCESDCKKDPKCVAFEINLDPSDTYCELHTDPIADAASSENSLCLVKKSPKTGRFSYTFKQGACRTSSGGLGTYTTVQLSPKDCESRCTNWARCVAFETRIPADNHCELHTEAITDSASDRNNICWVK